MEAVRRVARESVAYCASLEGGGVSNDCDD